MSLIVLANRVHSDVIDVPYRPILAARSGHSEMKCFYAFVDKRSHDLLLQENRGRTSPVTTGGGNGDGNGIVVEYKIGVWHLILLNGKMPFSSSHKATQPSESPLHGTVWAVSWPLSARTRVLGETRPEEVSASESGGERRATTGCEHTREVDKNKRRKIRSTETF